MDVTLYRLFYNYSFYHSRQAEIFGSVGMYVGDLDFVVDASGTITPPGGGANDEKNKRRPVCATSLGRIWDQLSYCAEMVYGRAGRRFLCQHR